MKILYTANERNDAQLVATELQRIAQDVALTWAGSLHDARQWITENQDLAALVVESQVQSRNAAPLVGYVRSLGLTPPVVVVAPEDGDPPLAALKAGADDYVLRNQSLVTDLTALLGRSLRRSYVLKDAPPLRLLYLGDGTLARGSLDRSHSPIDITEAAQDGNGQLQAAALDVIAGKEPFPYDALLIEHDHPAVDTFSILRDVARRSLQVPVILVVEWDEELALPALKLGATDWVVKTKASFRALFYRLDRRHREPTEGKPWVRRDSKEPHDRRYPVAAGGPTREELEQQVRDAQEALRSTERRMNALSVAHERLRQNEVRLRESVEEERASREQLEQRLATADESRQRADELRASVTARSDQAAQQAMESSQRLADTTRSHDSLVIQLKAANELASQRKSELDAARIEAAAIQDRLEQRLREAQTALEASEQRLLADQAARQRMSERQADFESRIDREIEHRMTLARRLESVETALDEAQHRLGSEMAAANERLVEQQTQHEAALAQLRASRQTLEQELTEAKAALERAGQAQGSHPATHAEELAQRDEAFALSLTRVIHSRDLLQQQLSELSGAFEQAQRDRAIEAAQAAEQLTRRESELTEVSRARQALEQQLRAAESSLHDRTRDLEATRRQVTSQEAQLAEVAASRLTLDRQLDATRLALASTEKKLEDAEEHRQSAMASAAAQLGAQQAQYQARLAEATSTRELLERRITQLDVERQNAEQRAAADRHTAEQQAAQRQAELTARIDQAETGRRLLEQSLSASQRKVTETEAALRDAGERHASSMAAAAAQLADQQAQSEIRLAQAATAERTLQDRLRAVTAALDRSEQERKADAAAASERLSLREAERDEAITNGQMLERRLADSISALAAVEQRAATDRQAAEQQATQRQAEFEARIEREEAARRSVEQTLAVTERKVVEREAALREAEERHASASAAAATQYAERQSELEARLTRAAAAHAALERTLADTQQWHVSELQAAADQLASRDADYQKGLNEAANALQAAEQRAAGERLAATEEAIQRQLEFDGRLAQEQATRRAIEQTLTTTREELLSAEVALRTAHRLHESEMTKAAARLSEQNNEFTVELARASAAQAALEQKLADAERQHVSALESNRTRAVEQQRQWETQLAHATAGREAVEHSLRQSEAALERIRQETASDAAAAAQRLSQSEAELSAAFAARQELERRVVDLEGALKSAEERALAERTAGIREAAQRSAEFDARLAREVRARTTITRDLEDTRAAAEAARRTFHDETAALTERMRLVEASLTEQLSRERADYESSLADQLKKHQALSLERDTLHQSFVSTRERLQELGRAHEDAKENIAALRQTLDQIRAEARQTLERVSREHAAALAEVRALVAERDGQIKDLTARHAASQQAAQLELAKREGELRAAIDARTRQIEQQQTTLEALSRELDISKTHQDALKAEAGRVPELTRQLDASRQEAQRQFEQSPLPIMRCSREGTLLEANRALVTSLGYRTVDELRALDIAASVFESDQELGWLINGCQTSPGKPAESVWRKKDGGRLIVRLHIALLGAHAVEIMAEDLTPIRAVEDRLREAQRMEAVGRLASEVAVTCDTLLSKASRDAQQWLSTVGNSTAHRQGELIFGEVTRAASFLRQLSVYGDEQTSALEPVDVSRVLRDVEPVLKRVAGDDIEFVLPKKLSALNVDVDAERLKRVLVNVAAYGRARMRSGGRLIVDLAKVTVDRDFVTRYPNVRQGAHALITITEVREAAKPGWPDGIREAVEAATSKATAEHPGVDLGTLQSLLRDCGGHLWMKAEPGGDLEVRIHLPLRPVDSSRLVGVARGARGRSAGRWFQT